MWSRSSQRQKSKRISGSSNTRLKWTMVTNQKMWPLYKSGKQTTKLTRIFCYIHGRKTFTTIILPPILCPFPMTSSGLSRSWVTRTFQPCSCQQPSFGTSTSSRPRASSQYQMASTRTKGNTTTLTPFLNSSLIKENRAFKLVIHRQT